ncbi:MAG: hypothetical protein EOO02_21190 [Chitinophagaceae bacterium]|nr:MAG: hypothetical protein EOO02_21190 [Chitinophagaceae bacterium]
MLQTPYEILVTKPAVFKREYHFLKDEKIFGTITAAKSFRPEIVSKSGDEEWKLTQNGWWRPSFQYVGSHRPYAKGKFRPEWNGRLDFVTSDGSKYTLKKVKWYLASTIWYKDDKPILRINPIHSFNNKRAAISVYVPGDPNIWLLISIAWHLYLINKRQATAAA